MVRQSHYGVSLGGLIKSSVRGHLKKEDLEKVIHFSERLALPSDS